MNKSAVIHDDDLTSIIELLNRLESAKIHFKLSRNRDDAITIEVAVPGQRWEIDCYPNGGIDVEVFKSDGMIHNITGSVGAAMTLAASGAA
ncbi:MAG TPA: hypothetical protein VF306_15400 [Pirellulales bacterium]